MLKIYKTYLQYQIDGGCWERFGYSGWLCEEERNVELQKTIIENASFKQAFEHFENCPSHNVISCRTYIRHRPCFLQRFYHCFYALYGVDFHLYYIYIPQ